MNEAGHQARTRKSVLLLRASSRLSSRAQSAHVHAQFYDSQQRFERDSAGQLRALARRDEEKGGRSVRWMQSYDGSIIPLLKNLHLFPTCCGAKLFGDSR